MIRKVIPLAIFALLAACGDGGSNGTSIRLDAKNDKGEPVTASTDGDSGRVAIDAPGLKASINLPKIRLDAENMDIGGVKLFPGSTVETLDVRGDDPGAKDSVRIAFDAPALQADVAKWFDAQLSEAGFTVSATANGVAGTSREGDPFRLELTPAGTHTRGTITVEDSD